MIVEECDVRWVTFRARESTVERVGIVDDRVVHALAEGPSLLSILEEGSLSAAAERAVGPQSDTFALEEIRIEAPLPRPPSVRDFAAFEGHVRNALGSQGIEIDPTWYEQPNFFFQNPRAIRGPFDDIQIAPSTRQWDYELEVAVIVGKTGTNLTPDEAAECIAGFSIFCDFSARDIQWREMRLGLGIVKAKDSATSLGPMLVTPDELEPFRSGAGYACTMTAEVNGVEYSRGSLDEMHWTFAEMLAYASRGTWLTPGDVIGTGTVTSGCILELSALHGEETYPWLQPGDEVVLTVDGLGSLRHRMQPASAVVPLR